MLDKIKKIVYNVKELVMVAFLLIKCDFEWRDIKFHKKRIMNIGNLQDSQEKEKKEWAIELSSMFEKDYRSLKRLAFCFILIVISPLLFEILVGSKFVKEIISIEIVFALIEIMYDLIVAVLIAFVFLFFVLVMIQLWVAGDNAMNGKNVKRWLLLRLTFILLPFVLFFAGCMFRGWLISLINPNIIIKLLNVVLIILLKLLMDKIKKSNTAFNSQVVATKDIGIGLKSFYNDLEYVDYIYKTIKEIHNNWKK